jgi:tetratricopeptide (TPR) repeat protein
MLRRQRFTLLLLPLVLLSLAAATQLEKPRTTALVVGTIHQRHAANANYTYADVVHLLSTFDPDLICVEIRPQDFRKVPYLKEMMLATVWGLSHGRAVAPIDWWDDTQNVREVRDTLAKQPEYIEKGKEEKDLYSRSPIVLGYEKKYGPSDKENAWSKNLGYSFWNGRDYNQFYAEIYRISMKVYGDSPFNLYYQTRNTHMMELIRKAIEDHHSRKVMVLTGSEHKHFFDAEFSKNRDVELVDFESLLPLGKKPLETAVLKFLDDDDDSPYYEPGFPADINDNFRNRLLPLVHGPDMDVFPETIPPANMEKASKVLARWKAAKSESDGQTFEGAWLDFLREDYGQAVDKYLILTRRIEEGTIQDPYIRFDSYLNLGRCYDLLGQRQKALDCYARSEKLLAGSNYERAKSYIFQNYKEVPYRRPKRK